MLITEVEIESPIKSHAIKGGSSSQRLASFQDDSDVGYGEKSDEENVDYSEFEKEREMMRNELNGYLDTLKELRGSDGNSLLSLPQNVDSVSAAMSRGDLTSKIQILGQSIC